MRFSSSSIQSRLLLVVFLLAGGLSALNLMLVYGLLRWEEDFLFERLLEQQLNFISTKGNQGAEMVPPFFFLSEDEQSKPEFRELIDDLTPGFYEMEKPDSITFLVGPRGEDGGSQIVAAKTGDFEFFERQARLVLISCAITLSITFLVALLMGGGLILRIVRPLRDLARILSSREPEDLDDPIAPNFPEDEIGQVAKAYDGVQSRLSDVLKREKKFSAEASHELRTPLTVALNAVELMRGNGVELSYNCDPLLRAERSLKRMRALVEAFLALGRSPSGIQNRTTIRLSEMIGDAVLYHEEAYGSSAVEICHHYEDDFALVGDVDLLRILIRNLVVNASVHAPGKALTVSTSGDGSLEFSNSTYAKSHSMSSDYKPTGIGLEIVSRIAKRIDYSLQYGESNGKFSVRLMRHS